jgi:hypothetical protein
MRVGLSLGVVVLLVLVAGCGRLGRIAPEGEWQEAAPAALTPQARPVAGAAAVLAPQGARTAAAFDRTTPAERAAALAAPAAGAALGQVVVSLGNPAEPGFWLRSSLVSAARPGTVRLASGASVQVDLLPPAGGAAQLSLAAYRALGLGLTDLPQVTVLGR